MRLLWLGVVIGSALASSFAWTAEPRRPKATPESRALAYLSREVPRWAAENKCYSCHNNGDGARALYTAIRLKIPIPSKALADTTRWLSQPLQWDHNGGKGPSSDKKLARLQLGAALTEAVAAGTVPDRKILEKAARLVAEGQNKDGSWQIDADGNIGSPVTYGSALATVMARRVLAAANAKHFAEVIARAGRWLCAMPVHNVLDAASVLLALENTDNASGEQRRKCLAIIRKGQSKDGGWGPYVNSSPEAFDTALVLLALHPWRDRKGVRDMLGRGRAFLITQQQEDGSWPETTRPSGRESYAQRLSTTAWATQALLLTVGHR